MNLNPIWVFPLWPRHIADFLLEAWPFLGCDAVVTCTTTRVSDRNSRRVRQQNEINEHGSEGQFAALRGVLVVGSSRWRVFAGSTEVFQSKVHVRIGMWRSWSSWQSGRSAAVQTGVSCGTVGQASSPRGLQLFKLTQVTVVRIGLYQI